VDVHFIYIIFIVVVNYNNTGAAFEPRWICSTMVLIGMVEINFDVVLTTGILRHYECPVTLYFEVSLLQCNYTFKHSAILTNIMCSLSI